ncbi:hypothetical protein C6Y45_14865 [Alkalicoccus saliphilus]|uniref:Uncharacterized protein n=1 Tax=Alkalicoccus saliphilus TaxID=200989 RepID=A0A2T4U2X6_9BACI|nr:hypothetical protein C6Y45_14865 [Alkalicoccus saliphilus]
MDLRLVLDRPGVAPAAAAGKWKKGFYHAPPLLKPFSSIRRGFSLRNGGDADGISAQSEDPYSWRRPNS